MLKAIRLFFEGRRPDVRLPYLLQSLEPRVLLSSTFVWPVVDQNGVAHPDTISQYYAAVESSMIHPPTVYHSGIDIPQSAGNVVRAAAAGTARVVPEAEFPNNNHGLGNVIIIDHNNGLGPFTLYAHLDHFLISSGPVAAGTPIAIMGNTGGNYATHLHFEVKQWGVLGDLGDDGSGLQWGDTVGFPSFSGYINPLSYVDYGATTIPLTAVRPITDQTVRTGPDSSTFSYPVASVTAGEEFASFGEFNGWYEIYLPSSTGPASGWIQGTPDGAAFLVRVSDPTRGTTGVSLRSSPAVTAQSVSYAWDNEGFVVLGSAPAGNGSSNPWYQVQVAGGTAWISGDYTTEVPGNATPAITGAATDGPVSAGGPVSITYTFAATSATSPLLGASLVNPSGGAPIDLDYAGAATVALSAGQTTLSRQYTVPGATAAGAYDLLTALYNDADGNGAIDPADGAPFFLKTFPGAVTVSTLTDQQKQQSMLNMVNAHRGAIPAELVLAVIFQEAGQGAFYVDGSSHNPWYRASDAPWAQPDDNPDGIMQVTAVNPYHQKSGPYTNDEAGYDHAIQDGCDYLNSLLAQYGTLPEAIVHYNSGPSTLYVYQGLGAGDRNYLANVSSGLRDLVPPMFGLSNSTLADALDGAQQILNGYLNDPNIASGQSSAYYAPFEFELDAALHNGAPTRTFSDDFNRPDSASVGNGWSELNGNPYVVISNGAAQLNQVSAFGGIYRPLSWNGPLTIAATLTQTNGYGGLPGAYRHDIWLRNDGTSQNGYGISISESDQISGNSHVAVVDRGVELEGVASDFQFGPSIDVQFTIRTDGSIAGSVADSTHRFNFSFGPHAIQSVGNNIAFGLGGPDPRASSSYIFPTIDNVRVALPGDVNGDGKVDFSDLLILAQNFNKTSDETWAEGDLNGDGKVDFADLLILAQNYGQSLTATASANVTRLLHRRLAQKR